MTSSAEATVRDLRNKCYALEVAVASVLLPLLRVIPRNVSSDLLVEIRHTLPLCLDDDPAVDRPRVVQHIREFADQIERILALETPPDARPN